MYVFVYVYVEVVVGVFILRLKKHRVECLFYGYTYIVLAASMFNSKINRNKLHYGDGMWMTESDATR